MLASKSIAAHLARGAIGFGSLALAVHLAPASPWAVIALVAVALAALRGCPTCWTLGLIQGVLARARGRRAEGICEDGSCAPRRP
ncbi:hypothetical protein SOCE26_061480 [Sorangium cellulosum]|uniref:DUF2892 domain-containing protein n=1 Tax=Sorangium cellulosum TaxID=56 RepID=A0A2L0EZF0_SORCE|nr:hypothetical protein [Sorangium cellulosum]AUX44681.1 hypothetical protein SOCE26_061480 [Sorangium cellulosum]